jgi:lipopolysaccharide transport system ATP-binding protein
MPVQNYSSGMKVRLGFAVAAQMEPDVLIIDEVLAVGDLGFILKCFKTIDTILPNTAVIFVSHNMPMVSRICNHIILMEKGEAKFQGEEVSKGIDAYYNKFLTNDESNIVFTDETVNLQGATVQGAELIEGIYNIKWGSSIKLNFKLKNLSLTKTPYISLAVYDKEQRAVAEIYPDGQVANSIKGDVVIDFLFLLKNIYLSKGVYHITFNASEGPSFNMHYKIHKAITLRIHHDKQMWTPFLLDSRLISTTL